EPLLVLLGRRGPRMLRSVGPRATQHLMVLGGGAALVGFAALALAPHGARLVAALLVAPVAACLRLESRSRRRRPPRPCSCCYAPDTHPCPWEHAPCGVQ